MDSDKIPITTCVVCTASQVWIGIQGTRLWETHNFPPPIPGSPRKVFNTMAQPLGKLIFVKFYLWILRNKFTDSIFRFDMFSLFLKGLSYFAIFLLIFEVTLSIKAKFGALHKKKTKVLLTE